MGASANGRSTFGNQLHQQLKRHQTIKSVRRLGRELTPSKPDSGRRLLHDWIAGTKKPTKTSRRAVALVLGVDPSVFTADDDEEEDMLSDLIDVFSRMRTKRRETGDPYAVVA